MDWSASNFDWNRARGFLVTAQEGSLSAAARALGTTQSTLSRQVSALEEELGVVLFERVGRGLELTPSGQELLEHVQKMGDGAKAMALAAAGQSQTLEGKVRVSASQAIALFQLPRIVSKLRQEQPGIQFEILASDSTSDLLHREADIAIRHYQPTEQTLIAKKIRESPTHLYAAPAYLERIGNPRSIKDLTHAEFIGFDDSDRFIKVLREHGLNLSKENFNIVTANTLVQWEFVKQGLGIGLIPANIAEAETGIIRIFPEFEPLMIPLWLVAHRELQSNRRIRYAFDRLAEELV